MLLNKLYAGSLIIMCSVFVCGTASAEAVWGRDIQDGRDFSIEVTGGAVVDLSGSVKETTRVYYDLVGRESDQGNREDYDLGDFGLDGGYGTVGVDLAWKGKYFTFQLDLAFMNPSTETTALRNYYIGVDSIEYGGSEYEYMMIPEGRPFTVDMFSTIIEPTLLYTPFTLKSESVSFTPNLNIGLFGFAGQYDIEAGEATGVVSYQEPPEDFVRGGSADGMLGLAIPAVGLGAELRIGAEDGVNLVIDGTYSVLQYDGGTGWLTSSDHREKDIDLEHLSAKASVTMEFPFSSGRCFTIGAEYRVVESEAMITSEEVSEEEAIERRERFDKDVDFSMSVASAKIGFTF